MPSDESRKGGGKEEEGEEGRIMGTVYTRWVSEGEESRKNCVNGSITALLVQKKTTRNRSERGK